MNVFDIIQMIAGAALSYSYIPQIIKMFKNKSAEDVSIGMYVLCVIGTFLISVYATNLIVKYNTGHMLMFTNLVSMTLAIISIILILKYQKNN